MTPAEVRYIDAATTARDCDREWTAARDLHAAALRALNDAARNRLHAAAELAAAENVMRAEGLEIPIISGRAAA